MANIRLRINNPFTIGVKTTFEDGTESLDRPRLVHVPSIKDKFHTITDYDDLQSISFKHWGDSKYWWVLRDVNNLDDIFTLDVGNSLVIPDLDKIKALAL